MDFREKLENLLCGKKFDSQMDYYIWGTGNTAQLYVEGMNRLEQEGLIIKGYVDSDQKKWGG